MLTKSVVLLFASVLAVATADPCTADETCQKNSNPHSDHALLQAKAKLTALHTRDVERVATPIARASTRVRTQKAKATVMRASAKARAEARARSAAKLRMSANKTKAARAKAMAKHCTETCRTAEEGCECAEGEHWCSDPNGMGVCAPGTVEEHPCPVMCNWDTEDMCWVEGTGDVCVSREEGCPCWGNENKCTDPNGDPSMSSPWCQADPCPVMCNWDTENMCWVEGTGDVCFSREEGCPCRENEKKCTDQWGTWCQMADMDCPAQTSGCESTEIMCWDYEAHEDKCFDKALGCPCPGHDDKTCKGPMGESLCSPGDMECPVHCSMETEVMCWDDEAMKNTCHTMNEGCPCPAGQVKCPDQWGGWCQWPGDICPLSCSQTQVHCWNDASEESCHDQNDGCPGPCGSGNIQCFVCD